MEEKGLMDYITQRFKELEDEVRTSAIELGDEVHALATEISGLAYEIEKLRA